MLSVVVTFESATRGIQDYHTEDRSSFATFAESAMNGNFSLRSGRPHELLHSQFDLVKAAPFVNHDRCDPGKNEKPDDEVAQGTQVVLQIADAVPEFAL